MSLNLVRWLPSSSCTGRTTPLKAARYSASRRGSLYCVRRWNCQCYRTWVDDNMDQLLKNRLSVYGLYLIFLWVLSGHWLTHNFREQRHCRSTVEDTSSHVDVPAGNFSTPWYSDFLLLRGQTPWSTLLWFNVVIKREKLPKRSGQYNWINTGDLVRLSTTLQ